MKQIHLRIGALFLLSLSLIGYEIAVMRSFSVGSWSNFGSTVISIALLGFGLAGTLLTFMQKRIRRAPNRWLQRIALLYMPSLALAHVVAQKIPFNPVMIASDRIQVLWIGAYYLAYAVPFFLGAVFINVAFIVMSSRIHTLYFWNMVGSGLGGFVILVCMYFVPPDLLVLPLLVLSFLAVLMCFLRYRPEKGGLSVEIPGFVLGVISLVLAGLLIMTAGKIRVSEFKGVSYARKYPDAILDYYTFSPMGEIHVYGSSFFHFAPGLSDTASINLENMPKEAFKGLYIDGSGPIGVMRKLEGSESEYMDFLPMSAPYQILTKPRVLLVKLGGGTSLFTALHHDAGEIRVVESNPDLIRMLRDPLFRDYNGELLENPRIEIIETEPRAYTSRTKERFDLVEISLIDSVGLSQAGGYPIDENYTYTVEAFEDYMDSLSEGGILSLTVWNKLSPPRNVPKLLSTVVEALKKQGVENAERRIFMFDLLLSTATVLVKNGDFTQEEIGVLRNYCRRMSFPVSYYPGIPQREGDFSDLLDYFTSLYRVVETPHDEGGPAPVNPDDLYHHSLLYLLSGRENDLYRDYVFNIRPATDSRPYYTAYLKPEKISQFMDQLGEVPEEWGYLLLIATLLVSIVAAVFIILIPVIFRWKELFRGRRGTLGIIVYYACLGMGYMLIEIYLIQRLVHFLANPIFSVSIVITSMLVLSGLGSLFARRYPEKRSRLVRFAVAAISLTLIFYIFGLSPLIDGLIGLPLIVKFFLAVLFIAPAAFFMGIPFPTGLTALETSRARLLPWALGMNGGLSVTGSVMAKLISVSYGFSACLGLALVLYVVVALTFRTNEKG